MTVRIPIPTPTAKRAKLAALSASAVLAFFPAQITRGADPGAASDTAKEKPKFKPGAEAKPGPSGKSGTMQPGMKEIPAMKNKPETPDSPAAFKKDGELAEDAHPRRNPKPLSAAIHAALGAALRRECIPVSPQADDEESCRRVTLDLIGRVPSVFETAGGFEQTCNARAAVEIEIRLVVSPTVTDAPDDTEQLLPTLDCVSPVVKSIGAALIAADFTAKPPSPLLGKAARVRPRHRSTRPPDGNPTGAPLRSSSNGPNPPGSRADASAKQIMAHRLAMQAGRKLYAQRK